MLVASKAMYYYYHTEIFKSLDNHPHKKEWHRVFDVILLSASRQRHDAHSCNAPLTRFFVLFTPRVIFRILGMTPICESLRARLARFDIILKGGLCKLPADAEASGVLPSK